MNTPTNIQYLQPNEVFVFGSNLSGRHGAGAALTARKKFGAVYGQAEGLQGQSYAIPTVNAAISDKLSLSEIKTYVDTFLEFAKTHQNRLFYVTEIGCGLAGWSVQDIAPMFQGLDIPDNVVLPARFT